MDKNKYSISEEVSDCGLMYHRLELIPVGQSKSACPLLTKADLNLFPQISKWGFSWCHQQRHAPEVQHRERRWGSLTATVSTILETQYSSWYSAAGRARAALGRDSRLCSCQDILTHRFSWHGQRDLYPTFRINSAEELRIIYIFWRGIRSKINVVKEWTADCNESGEAEESS